jgi:Flp pilus assembly pilin Flp
MLELMCASSALNRATDRNEGRCMSVLTSLKARLKREEGQTMAEYAVVLAVITVATVAVFTALSGGITNAINNVTGLL